MTLTKSPGYRSGLRGRIPAWVLVVVSVLMFWALPIERNCGTQAHWGGAGGSWAPRGGLLLPVRVARPAPRPLPPGLLLVGSKSTFPPIYHIHLHLSKSPHSPPFPPVFPGFQPKRPPIFFFL